MHEYLYNSILMFKNFRRNYLEIHDFPTFQIKKFPVSSNIYK